MLTKLLMFISGIFFCFVPLSFAQQTVDLEINAVHIVLNDEHRQGVDWEAIVSDFHSLQLKHLDYAKEVDKKHKISVGNISSEDYTVLLEALDTVGKMTQHEQPEITIIPDAKTGIDINFADGKNFNHVHLDVLIKSPVKEELKLMVETGVEYPVKENGKMAVAMFHEKTDVILKQDSSIVLGGIISEQEVTKTHKFPLLGDLPIVGLVFRSHGRLMQRIETVIFITPRIKVAVEETAKE